MNKKIYLLLTVLLAWSFNLKAQTAQIGSLTANPGDPVSFDITLGDIPTTVGAVSLFIGYDPNVLTYTGFEPGTTDFTGFIINNMSGSNQVGIQWTDTDGDSDINGVILTLEFQYNNLGGSCDLTFNPGCEFTNVDFTSIDVSYTNGGIGPNAGIPTVTIDELVAPPGPVSVGLTGNGFTEEVGAISLFIKFDQTVMQYVDFETTLLNVGGLFVTGNNSTGEISIIYTNMDGDDDLNLEFLTLNFNFDGTDITELVFLSGCEIANPLTIPMAVSYDNGKVTPEPTDFNIWIENKVAAPGNVIGIEVYADGYDGVYDMGAVTLNIGFNPAHLTFIDITEGTLAGATANLSGPGLISIVWTNYTPGFLFDGTLLTLNFDYNFGASPVFFQGGCNVVDMGLGFIPTTYTDGSIAPVTGGPEVYLPTKTGTIGQTIDFPITAMNFNLWEPAAVSMFVGYDNAVLTYTGFTEGILTGSFVNTMPGSQVGIQWVNLGGIPVEDDDVLITLSFTYNGGECPLTFNGGCEFAEFDFDIIPVSYFDGAMITGTLFDLKAILEGPFNGTDMNTYLLTDGYLPLVQPYNAAPWNYTGNENVTSFPANVVDWVLLEIRETTGDASTATAATMVARKAAFILADGSIVDLDETSNVLVPTSFNDNVYVVIYHRNHLSMMSSTALIPAGDVYTYDFTTAQSQAYLDGQKALSAGFGMYAGDGNGDGQVSNFDLFFVWMVEDGLTGYYNGDFDMNSNVQLFDLFFMWMPNDGFGTMVP
jgi:hypothetical protein